ncbi:MotA/TolQ/ExbB proton channel family protein [Ferrimonas sp. SCSIO 43195]|uniref:MotA/TolQ/ExbB proton channel family protein n=1 Tax=Ferrimonas sp. SCSIO 43195 TaxID=2822844 RepID=UPI002074EDFB|nr:MotA/TolQ/ExbB proton channel family protein [Ferrimonas sp. SCSIO 43195]USD39464.1 MotA/TolQ/ExbB proton channel family protein [Ferrimonas sp. SCSIO 43195]
MTEAVTEILDYLRQGGPIMWPLLLCCVTMLWLAAGLLMGSGAHCQHRVPTTGVAWLDQRLYRLESQRQFWQPQGQLQAITLLATTAPLLGLLGTVNGMIVMFDALSHTGLHDGKALSDGIAMAMITTQTGLLVGVPGLLLAYLWRRRLARLQRQQTGASTC